MRKTASGRSIWVWNMILGVVLLALILPTIAACGTVSPPAPPITTATPKATVETNASSTPEVEVRPTVCALPTVIAPTMPAEVPGYTELDPTTGLHVTGKPQEIDLESYRLEVSGKVNHPLGLSYDDLRCMPRIEASPKLICPGFFEDVATWAGVPLEVVLELAGVQEGASGINLIGTDGYSISVPIASARSDENFLAYEWEGEPLPILHGFPVRAVFPGLAGSRWVKWLIKIEVY